MSYNKKNPFLRKVAVEMLCLVVISVVCSACYSGETKKGYVTFGANSHVINCISQITVFLDDENIGTLQGSVDSISDCGMSGNLTKETFVGEHIYRVEVRPANGGEGCLKKDITGTFRVSEGECTTVFIDYYQLLGNNSCDQDVIISETEYKNAPNDSLKILDMKIVGNCLKIKFGASGCDGSTWDVKLICWGNYDKSDPPQTTLRLSLDNKEMCAAAPTKEISFNLEPLKEYFQHHGTNQLVLNILGQQGILYEY